MLWIIILACNISGFEIAIVAMSPYVKNFRPLSRVSSITEQHNYQSAENAQDQEQGGRDAKVNLHRRGAEENLRVFRERE